MPAPITLPAVLDLRAAEPLKAQLLAARGQAALDTWPSNGWAVSAFRSCCRRSDLAPTVRL